VSRSSVGWSASHVRDDRRSSPRRHSSSRLGIRVDVVSWNRVMAHVSALHAREVAVAYRSLRRSATALHYAFDSVDRSRR
jgi:hypothetical protein